MATMAMMAACRRTVVMLFREAKDLVAKVRNRIQRMKMTTNPCSPTTAVHFREVLVASSAASCS